MVTLAVAVSPSLSRTVVLNRVAAEKIRLGLEGEPTVSVDDQRRGVVFLGATRVSVVTHAHGQAGSGVVLQHARGRYLELSALQHREYVVDWRGRQRTAARLARLIFFTRAASARSSTATLRGRLSVDILERRQQTGRKMQKRAVWPPRPSEGRASECPSQSELLPRAERAQARVLLARRGTAP